MGEQQVVPSLQHHPRLARDWPRSMIDFFKSVHAAILRANKRGVRTCERPPVSLFFFDLKLTVPSACLHPLAAPEFSGAFHHHGEEVPPESISSCVRDDV